MSFVGRPPRRDVSSHGPSGKFGRVQLHELFARVVSVAAGSSSSELRAASVGEGTETDPILFPGSPPPGSPPPDSQPHNKGEHDLNYESESEASSFNAQTGYYGGEASSSRAEVQPLTTEASLDTVDESMKEAVDGMIDVYRAPIEEERDLQGLENTNTEEQRKKRRIQVLDATDLAIKRDVVEWLSVYKLTQWLDSINKSSTKTQVIDAVAAIFHAIRQDIYLSQSLWDVLIKVSPLGDQWSYNLKFSKKDKSPFVQNDEFLDGMQGINFDPASKAYSISYKLAWLVATKIATKAMIKEAYNAATSTEDFLTPDEITKLTKLRQDSKYDVLFPAEKSTNKLQGVITKVADAKKIWYEKIKTLVRDWSNDKVLKDGLIQKLMEKSTQGAVIDAVMSIFKGMNKNASQSKSLWEELVKFKLQSSYWPLTGSDGWNYKLQIPANYSRPDEISVALKEMKFDPVNTHIPYSLAWQVGTKEATKDMVKEAYAIPVATSTSAFTERVVNEQDSSIFVEELDDIEDDDNDLFVE